MQTLTGLPTGSKMPFPRSPKSASCANIARSPVSFVTISAAIASGRSGRGERRRGPGETTTAKNPTFCVIRRENNDRDPIGERPLPPAQATAHQIQPPPPVPVPPPDLERQPVEQQHRQMTAAQGR